MSVASPTRRRNSRRRVEVTPRDARPRVEPCVSMHQAIDALAVAMDQVVALAAVGADGVTNATGLGAGEVAIALAAERRRLEAALADVVGVHAASGEWNNEGFATPKAWLRARTGEGAAASGRLIVQSKARDTCPLMTAAWADGTVTWGHVAVLTDAHKSFPHLRDGLTAIEADLAYAASGVEPEEFGRILFEHLHALDPQAMDDADAQKRRDSVGLHASRCFDGYVRVDGLLSPEVGEALLSALTAAREATREPKGETPPGFLIDKPSLSQRNMSALAHIIAVASRVAGSDGLPDTHGERPVVHITIPTESLICERDDTGALPGWIENFTGQPVTPITAEAARRISCDATTRLISLDPRGCVDTISASVRTISPKLRRYILTRDGGVCRYPGCHSPIHEIHHVIHWARGGPTTTNNLAGLCHHHHHLVHEGNWTLHGNPESTLTFTNPAGLQWRSPPLQT